MFPTDTGSKVAPNVLIIDTGGNRTEDVYAFALRDVGRIIPIKGASHGMRQPNALSKLNNGVPLRIIDTGYYKSFLNRLINDPDKTKWSPYLNVDDSYCAHMASEQQVVDRKTGKMIWSPVNSAAPNHWFDCEVYSVAAMDIGNFSLIQPNVPAPQRQPDQPQHNHWLGSGSSWLGNNGSWL